MLQFTFVCSLSHATEKVTLSPGAKKSSISYSQPPDVMSLASLTDVVHNYVIICVRAKPIRLQNNIKTRTLSKSVFLVSIDN